jgi:anti-sigma B factor antagonist
MLKVHAEKLGSVAVFHLHGRVVHSEAEVLRNAVLLQTDASAVVLDFARVSTIDAAGLGVMLELREQTQSKGVDFRIRNVTKLVRQVLQITRLDSVFEMTAQSVMPFPGKPEIRLPELTCRTNMHTNIFLPAVDFDMFSRRRGESESFKSQIGVDTNEIHAFDLRQRTGLDPNQRG